MIKDEIKEFYLKTSMYTHYGEYKNYFISLPNEMESLTKVISNQIIHRTKLRRSYSGVAKIYDDENYLKQIKQEYPWYYYRSHDDILLTASAITSELFRLDSNGFTENRKIENKVVITCRYVACLLASILKAKDIPARVRSGFVAYISNKNLVDHWICQYYNKKENRWINVDANDDYKVDFSLNDIPNDNFEFIADIWLKVRNNKEDISKYVHGNFRTGINMLAETLFYDFHSLMNNELSYLFVPVFLSNKEKLTETELLELDKLALLMTSPDNNFNKLKYIYENHKDYRAINTPLLSNNDHLELHDD